MSVVAIIQARMGSTRLPGKVLMDIAGKSMLARVVERTRRTPGLNEIVVATTTRSEDDAIIDECRSLGVATFRGSEHDVLDRYYRAARQFKAETIVRITADCPLIDPDVIHKVLQQFNEQKPDYASNTLQRTYPRGLDTEVFSIEALEQAWRTANQTYEREHVTPYIYGNRNRFKLLSVVRNRNSSIDALRWTVDTKEDLEFVRAVYESLGRLQQFGWRDVLALLEHIPQLTRINSHIQQKR